MTRRILSLLLALMLLGSISITAFAHDVPDVTREDCSIEVVVRYDGEPVPGGKLTCIRVGDVYENDGNYSFRRVMDGNELDDVQSETVAQELAQFVEDNKDDFAFESLTVTVDEEGKALFENLKVGLYLIVQDTPADGFSELNPFLVGLPYMEDGEYQYQVSAAVKSEVLRESEPSFTIPQSPADKEPENPSEDVPQNPSDNVPQNPSDRAPQTGQLNWPVPVLAVGGLLLFAIGWALRFGRKKVSYEE